MTFMDTVRFAYLVCLFFILPATAIFVYSEDQMDLLGKVFLLEAMLAALFWFRFRIWKRLLQEDDSL